MTYKIQRNTKHDTNQFKTLNVVHFIHDKDIKLIQMAVKIQDTICTISKRSTNNDRRMVMSTHV